MEVSILLLACTAIALTFLKRYIFSKIQKRLPLPPGPPGDRLLGHLRLIPSVGQDVFFYEMGKIYGDVMRFRVLGKSLVILNSVQAAVDLLDNKSYNYSDRPRLPIFELSGVGDTLVFLKYGKEFRIQRRMIQQYFSKERRKDHRPIQTREASVLVQNLLSKPEDLIHHLLRFSTAIIIEVSYGHHIVSDNDPYLKIADDVCLATAQSGPPGSTPVDLLPFLQYLPSWFPGTYYATHARNAWPSFRKLYDYPLPCVTEQMGKGAAKPSFLASQLEKLNHNDPENTIPLENIKAASAILYVAGADTTSSSLSFFLLAMVLYPECQVKAQEEIDTIVGSDRLPEFHDRENLPYLEYVLQETLRWNQAVPSGVPHASVDDDVYNGMFIPKGSTIIANTRGMTLDESVYKDASEFDPTRFLPAPAGRGEPFPNGPFGFGRRICPGRHLADDSLWIAIATVLSTLSISKAIGNDGEEIVPDATPVAAGIASRPRPFSCRLEPRTDIALNLLKQVTET